MIYPIMVAVSIAFLCSVQSARCFVSEEMVFDDLWVIFTFPAGCLLGVVGPFPIPCGDFNMGYRAGILGFADVVESFIYRFSLVLR